MWHHSSCRYLKQIVYVWPLTLTHHIVLWSSTAVNTPWIAVIFVSNLSSFVQGIKNYFLSIVCSNVTEYAIGLSTKWASIWPPRIPFARYIPCFLSKTVQKSQPFPTPKFLSWHRVHCSVQFNILWEAETLVHVIRLDNTGDNKKLQNRSKRTGWKFGISFKYKTKATPKCNY